MEIYDLAYLKNRVNFMVNLNKLKDAKEMVEREVEYVVERCNEGRADIGYIFYKNFGKYMSNKSCDKLHDAINSNGDEKTISAFNQFLGEDLSV